MATNDYLISSRYIRAGNLNIHYLTAGEGEPVVLLHGWPTHSYLPGDIGYLSSSRRCAHDEDTVFYVSIPDR